MMNKLKISLLVGFSFLFFFNCKKTNKIPPQNGIFIEWYDKNTVRSIVQFRTGKLDSICHWYYPEGQLKVRANYSMGIQTGETIHYFPNGKVKTYLFFNQEGVPRYKKEFDVDGELVKEEGKPISVMFEKERNISINEYFPFYVDCARPPNSKLTIFTAAPENDIHHLDSGYRVLDKMPFYKKKYNSPGKKKILVISKLVDTVYQDIKHDTISFVINVHSK
jgi:hypothetical protein